jgi:hypothetical protein|tara:strand:+ start:783 stop:1016 length:234 start_codon:yes stop_codon:yes gene_type:complete
MNQAEKDLRKKLEGYPFFLDIRKVSEISGLHPNSIWNKIKEGELKSTRRFKAGMKKAGKHMIEKERVIQWLLERAKK